MTKSAVKERTAPLFGEVDPPAKPKAEVVVTEPKGKKKAGTAVAIPEPPQPRSLLEICMWAAKQKDIPPDRLRAFLDMAKEQERAEAEVLFDEAMLAAQSDMPPIPRESYNKHTKSWWTKIEAVSAKVDPIIRNHGFTLKYGVGEPRMEDHYHLFVDVTWNGKLASGKKASFTKRFEADIGRDDKGPKGEGTKSLAQGSGSSITYGRRYLKLMVFDVLVLGMDKDGAPTGRETISKDQLKDLRARLTAANIGEDAFCEVFKIDKVEHLAADQLPAAIAKIDRKVAHA